jgi:hypothetical protein
MRSAAEADEAAFPRKRLVKSSTRRLRGNVMDVAVGAITIQADACPCQKDASTTRLGMCAG